MTAPGTRDSSMLPRQRVAFLVAIAALAVMASGGGAAEANDEAGTVAAVEGTAEIGRGGTWQAAAAGSSVQVGDELKTGNPGRMRVVFRDDTVLNLADDTQVTVDQQVFAPDQGLFRSSMQLLRGKVRALVGEYYSRPAATYEINTATAVAVLIS